MLKVEEYLRKVLSDEQPPATARYLPHFPVVRMDKSTTKVRIVFDCAAKCDGISLNYMIHVGPKLQQDLFNVLVLVLTESQTNSNFRQRSETYCVKEQRFLTHWDLYAHTLLWPRSYSWSCGCEATTVTTKLDIGWRTIKREETIPLEQTSFFASWVRDFGLSPHARRFASGITNVINVKEDEASQPVTAPPSKMRLRFSFRPFAQRTVDFAGLLYTVQGRGKPRRKRWLCLFTCLKTRAVHLEMLFNPLRWPIYVFNSVVNTKLPAFTTVSLNRVSEARKCGACYN